MLKNKKIELRVTEEEKKNISEMALKQNLTVSEFILNRVLNFDSHGTGVEFGIVSVNDFPNLRLSYKQIKLNIEAIYVYLQYVSNVNNPNKLVEYENASELYEYLQEIYNYNYEDACNKCFNKFAKKYIKDDPGQETFSWL